MPMQNTFNQPLALAPGGGSANSLGSLTPEERALLLTQLGMTQTPGNGGLAARLRGMPPGGGGVMTPEIATAIRRALMGQFGARGALGAQSGAQSGMENGSRDLERRARMMRY